MVEAEPDRPGDYNKELVKRFGEGGNEQAKAGIRSQHDGSGGVVEAEVKHGGWDEQHKGKQAQFLACRFEMGWVHEPCLVG